MSKKKNKTLLAIQEAKAILDDKKAENIVVLDVRNLSTVTDYYLVCTGNNSRHLKALADACVDALIPQDLKPYRQSGTPESAWLVLDYLDFVVHVFDQRAREHYALETLWKDAPRVS
ncbi:MAG TPA: ribosome silencing factor [Kiritimatiellia bacterium]|nr:ribosome silencing factor [Kiritimatiellia bacterium]HMO98309.1 ribosome silencing factor [Kiritimatiellia bacterium]HMP95495.1 ribosome silencing factor [Kiritimatiellia bacterium]